MSHDELTSMIKEQSKEIEKIKSQQNNVDLKEFYLNKYQEMYEEIVKNRIEEIDNELKEMDNEIVKLTDSVSRIEEDIHTNELTKQKIEIVEQKIYECYAQMEEERFKSETVCDKLQRDTIVLCNQHHMHVESWFTTLNNYYNGLITNGELLDQISQLTNLMNNECYELSLKIKNNEIENRRLEKILDDKIFEIRKQLDSLIKEKERYEQYLYEVSTEQKMALKNDLQIRLEHKVTYLQEIKASFIEMSSKQLKEFTDLYNKNYLISKPSIEQVQEYDQLFSKFKSRLITIDTKSNLDYQRKKRLSFLQQEKARLDEIKSKKDGIDEKVKRFKEASVVIKQTIEELDLHVENIKKELTQYQNKNFILYNDYYLKDIKECKKAIEHQQQLITSLKEERTYRLFDPEVEKIKELDNEIHVEELNLNDLIKRLDNVEENYAAFLKENDNNQIKVLLEEGQYFEEKIPQLKIMHEKLNLKIDTFENESLSLSKELVDYQDIVMQIEELKYED
ncbi:MAG: hypothetical protein IKC22_06630 [Bacilli bacterium]|nr:hypothetical protein [Bacilli bacterium]